MVLKWRILNTAKSAAVRSRASLSNVHMMTVGITDPSRPDADSKIAEAMAAAVEAEEANHKAWIISGFPNTRAQVGSLDMEWVLRFV